MKIMLLQIRAFLAVIEEGSLHRAAKRLNLSQSALSRQMQALEFEIGGKLLERSASGVTLTTAGRAFAERMKPFLETYDAHLLAVRRIIRGAVDELKIGYLASAFDEYLQPALEKLRRLHPKTKVKLFDLFSGEQITALRRGDIDVALIQEGGKLLGRDFHTQKLAIMRSFVALPEDHRLASRREIKVAELKNEVFLTGPDIDMPGLRRRLTQICRSCGKFTPKVIQITGDLAQAFSTIANDGAISLMPAFLRSQKPPGVVLVPISDAAATWDLFVAWQRGHTGVPLRTLIESLPVVGKTAGP